MSREPLPEAIRRSPNVIARLMGLDVLPPQQSTYQQKGPSGKPASLGKSQVGCQSSQKSLADEHEFKDVYEVQYTSKKKRHSSQEVLYSNFYGSELELMRQKSINVKRHSADEKIQDTKELIDAIELLELSKDPNFFQRPDSLKHLHNLQDSSTNDPVYKNTDLVYKTEKKYTRKHRCKSPHKHHDNFHDRCFNRHTAHTTVKTSNSPVDRKVGSAKPSTRIVVLKPNLGNMQSAARTTGTPLSSRDSCSNIQLPISNITDMKFRAKKILHGDAGIPMHRSVESRRTAREITRNMREGIVRSCIKNSSSKFRGYAGDESSSNSSENEYSYDSLDLRLQHRVSSSCSTRSSISQEARKRLSTRWKSTHKSQKSQGIRKGSTLAEMLARSDREVMVGSSDAEVLEQEFSRDKLEEWVEPMGISSSDGWKEKYVKNLSRSTSLPASNTSFKNLKTRQSFRSDKHLMQKKPLNRCREKVAWGDFYQAEYSRSRKSTSNVKRSQVCISTFEDSRDSLQHLNLRKSEAKKLPRKKVTNGCDYTVSEKPTIFVTENRYSPDHVVDVEIKSKTMVSEDPAQESAAISLVVNKHSVENLSNMSSEEPLDLHIDESTVKLKQSLEEIHSPSSSNEADEPSPVSVLEGRFPDHSASEYFESLSTDLQGLRMQLQLLKSGSEEPYTVGPMLLSSDDDISEGRLGFSDHRGIRITEEDWESSYVMNVLINSGINNSDLGGFMATCHTPELPIHQSVFQQVEKYYESETWGCHDRKLLFDCINSVLVKMCQKFADPHPWATIGTESFMWNKNGLKDTVLKMVASSRNSRDDVEYERFDLGDEIRGTGKDIETLILEDLLMEVVATYMITYFAFHADK